MRSRTQLRLMVIGALALLVTASATAAALSSVQLNLQGGYANRRLTACTLEHHYTFFRPRTKITMDGGVSPTPAGSWQVKVKVKQCLRGRFRAIWSRHVSGRSDGTFRVTYRTSRSGYFFARAYYYGVTPTARSDKQYFRSR